MPEFESSASTETDNLLVGLRSQSTSKISAKLPSDDWLSWKLEKLNLTLTECYPTHSTDTNGLSRDEFVKVPHTLKWYDVYSNKKDFSWSKITYWSNEPAKIDSAFTRIARPSLSTKLPTSWPIAQEKLYLQPGSWL